MMGFIMGLCHSPLALSCLGLFKKNIAPTSTSGSRARALHLAPPFLVEGYTPVATTTNALGRMKAKVAAALAELGNCKACPRNCGVDRLADNKSGQCRVGRRAIVSSAFPHFGEESVLQVGTRTVPGYPTQVLLFVHLLLCFCSFVVFFSSTLLPTVFFLRHLVIHIILQYFTQHHFTQVIVLYTIPLLLKLLSTGVYTYVYVYVYTPVFPLLLFLFSPGL